LKRKITILNWSS